MKSRISCLPTWVCGQHTICVRERKMESEERKRGRKKHKENKWGKKRDRAMKTERYREKDRIRERGRLIRVVKSGKVSQGMGWPIFTKVENFTDPGRGPGRLVYRPEWSNRATILVSIHWACIYSYTLGIYIVRLLRKHALCNVKHE